MAVAARGDRVGRRSRGELGGELDMSLDVDPSGAGASRFDDLDVFERLTGAARDDAFMDTEREIRSLQARQALRVHRVGRCASHLDDGHHTVKNWHQAVTNGSP